MTLTDSQRSALHASILEYLTSSGFSSAAAAFASDAGLGLDAPPPPPATEDKSSAASLLGGGTLLEKKWTSVVRLQKKVIELEAIIKKGGGGGAASDPLSSSSSSSSSSSALSRHLPISDPPPKVCAGHKGGGINDLALHPTFCTVASAGEDGTIKLWDWESGTFESTLKGHTSGVQSVCYNKSGSLLASSSSDLSIKLWSVPDSYDCKRTLRGHDHNVSCVRFLPAPPSSPDLLLSASRDGSLKFWDSSTGYCVHTLTPPPVAGQPVWLRAVAPSSCGSCLAFAGGGDYGVYVHSAGDKRQMLHILRGHEHVVEALAFAPPEAKVAEKEGGKESMMLVSAARDKSVRVWNAATGVCVHVFSDHESWVRAVAVHRSGEYVISVGDDRAMRVLDVKNQRTLKTHRDAHEHFVTALAVSESRNVVVTAGIDNLVKCWHVK